MTNNNTIFKYYAFISYSRKNSKAAAYLHKQLEHFRVPVKYVAEENRPAGQKFLRPVFRDRRDLEAGEGSFTGYIKNAIEQSRHLIVLCSPESATSLWVNEEVKHFLATHDNDYNAIVPVILNGAPGGGGTTECLPEALRLNEITMRNLPSMIPDEGDDEKTGWENGVVQAMSYMLKVNREKIKATVDAEKVRQAKIYAVIGIVATIVFALLATWAIHAERQATANERRAIAGEQEAKKQQKRAEAGEKLAKENEAIAEANQKLANKNANARKEALDFIETLLVKSSKTKYGNASFLVELISNSDKDINKIQNPIVKGKVSNVAAKIYQTYEKYQDAERLYKRASDCYKRVDNFDIFSPDDEHNLIEWAEMLRYDSRNIPKILSLRTEALEIGKRRILHSLKNISNQPPPKKPTTPVQRTKNGKEILTPDWIVYLLTVMENELHRRYFDKHVQLAYENVILMNFYPEYFSFEDCKKLLKRQDYIIDEARQRYKTFKNTKNIAINDFLLSCLDHSIHYSAFSILNESAFSFLQKSKKNDYEFLKIYWLKAYLEFFGYRKVHPSRYSDALENNLMLLRNIPTEIHEKASLEMAQIHSNIAFFANAKEKYPLTQRHLLQAIKRYEAKDNKNLDLAWAYECLGRIKVKNNKNQKALEYFLKSLAIYSAKQKHSNMAELFYLVGFVKCKLKQYSDAMENMKKYQELCKTHKLKTKIQFYLIYGTLLASCKKDYDSAIKLMEEGIPAAEMQKDKEHSLLLKKQLEKIKILKQNQKSRDLLRFEK